MHYCIGDVHGCYDEMIALIDKIESQDENAEIIFVGDFIDRGPKVWEVLEWVRSHVTVDGKYRAVLGNHEDMVLQWFKEFEEWHKDMQSLDFDRPMPETHYDFLKVMADHEMLTPDQIRPIMEFFETLPLEIDIPIEDIDGYRVMYRIVHAWVADEIEDPDAKRMQILWDRDHLDHDKTNEIIVHGHTPTILSEKRGGLINYYKNAINLDGGCCFHERYPQNPSMLCGICLETWREFYPCSLEERIQGVYGQSAFDPKTIPQSDIEDIFGVIPAEEDIDHRKIYIFSDKNS